VQQQQHFCCHPLALLFPLLPQNQLAPEVQTRRAAVVVAAAAAVAASACLELEVCGNAVHLLLQVLLLNLTLLTQHQQQGQHQLWRPAAPLQTSGHTCHLLLLLLLLLLLQVAAAGLVLQLEGMVAFRLMVSGSKRQDIPEGGLSCWGSSSSTAQLPGSSQTHQLVNTNTAAAAAAAPSSRSSISLRRAG